MSGPPLVTVIVPTFAEASDIGGCLASVAAQDHPREQLEVIVVDGCSPDGTMAAARRALDRLGLRRARVIENPGRLTPSNLNVGLRLANGEIVCRVDARTRIEPHYVRTCVELLVARPELAVVGGAQVALPRGSGSAALGIARALNNRWSMGGSAYRVARRSGPSDTVYLGAFRRADLLEAGGWEDALASNQDFDLNRRLSARGIVWFDARLRSGYVPRESVASLWRQYRRFGRAKVDYWRHTGSAPEPRQWLLLALPPLAGVVSAAVIGVSTHRDRSIGLLVLGGATAAAGIEILGTDEPRGGFRAHGMGVVAMTTVGAAWWWGVLQRFVSARGARRGG